MAVKGRAETSAKLTLVLWARVPDWPYEVSNLGRVRRTEGPTAYRVLKSFAQKSKGYLTVTLHKPGGHRSDRLVHHLVAAAFLGDRPEGAQIDHRDGDKRHNAVTNLEYVTGSENMRRAVASGLVKKPIPKGSRLTKEAIGQILHRVECGETQRHIAADMGISPAYVTLIKQGRLPASAL